MSIQLLFQNIIKTQAVQQLKYLIQMVFRLDQEHQKLVPVLQLVILVIGTEDGKKVTVNTKLIDDNGTAKVQVEGEMDITVSRANDPTDTIKRLYRNHF